MNARTNRRIDKRIALWLLVAAGLWGRVDAASPVHILAAGGSLGVQNLSTEFSLTANPTSNGWLFAESLANGGGAVGAKTDNWNQPDFGPKQPGWLGKGVGPHAGWARRIDNGDETPTFDDPVSSILTHGPTSVRWKVPADSKAGYMNISGGVWNIRMLGRTGTWRLWKNDVELLSKGTLNDTTGTSETPGGFEKGAGGESALQGVPYFANDTFRLEILEEDFVGVQWVLTPGVAASDPAIAMQPQSQILPESSSVTLNVLAVGTTPITYQWQKNRSDLPNETGDTLTLNFLGASDSAAYRCVVKNAVGSNTTHEAILRVNVPPPAQPPPLGAYDLFAQFTLDANPTTNGWQYSESLDAEGGPVGAAIPNWNQPDFGPRQPGWSGQIRGAHAGWAKRIDNGNLTVAYDDPPGSILTHGPTSVLWTVPPEAGAGALNIRGGIWQIRKLERTGIWKLWKNDTTLLSQGDVNDNIGTSQLPGNLAYGSGGSNALKNVDYQAGDSFRVEILNNDFAGIFLRFTPSTGEPPVLTATRQNGVLTFSWTGGGLLQTADDLGSPWRTIPGSSPKEVNITGGHAFFRILLQ